MTRVFTLFGDIEKDAFLRLSKEMLPLLAGQTLHERPEKPVLVVSSRGGSIEEAIQIHEFIRQIPLPVVTLGLGFVESAGFIVYLAGKRRLATSGTRFMFHAGVHSIRAPVTELKTLYRTVELQNNTLAGLVMDATGKGRVVVNRWYHRGLACSARDAQKLGIVHEVVSDSVFRDEEVCIDGDEIIR